MIYPLASDAQSLHTCVELSKTFKKESLPAECDKYFDAIAKQQMISKQQTIAKQQKEQEAGGTGEKQKGTKDAWEGATFKDRASAAESVMRGQPGYYKLQRRFTNSKVQNPYEP